MLESFGRLVNCIKPEIVSIENVPELSKQPVFYEFIKSLEDQSYNVNWHIVYCSDYGVAQSRKRLVLLASLLGDIDIIPPMFAPEEYLTVRNVIGNLPPINAGQADNDDPLHCASRLSATNLIRISHSVPGGSWREWTPEIQLDCHKKQTGSTYPSVYGRMIWDEPSPTITTQFYGYGNGRFGHPEQNRALSIREGAMLQSFPRSYQFVSPGEKVIKRELGIHIGNAVPVNLGRAIGVSIQKHLEEVAGNV